MTDHAGAVVTASTQLIAGLTSGQPPLTLVADSLADLASALGVGRVMVAIDDQEYGRQVFCSGRAPLGERDDLLSGPPRACTEPEQTLDPTIDALVVAAVGAAFERARRPEIVVHDAAAEATDAWAGAGELFVAIDAATERANRYGWGFTLVMLRFDISDDKAADHIRARLRSGDTLVHLGTREYGIVLPAIGGDAVPQLLARFAEGAAISTFCYGLAACPGDRFEAGALLSLATTRLREAEAARADATAPEIHAPEASKV